MLHLREFFEANEFGHLNRTEFANFAEVIAEKVRNHKQLGHFFCAGLQFVSQLRVARWIARSWAGSFNRPGQDVRAAQAQEEFGRGRDNLEISAIEERSKRCGR